MTLSLQSLIFATMLLTGVFLGLWLDLFRFINRRGKLPIPFFLDIIFWAVITAVVFTVLINVNYLELRLYIFFALGLGLFLYLKLCSRYILVFYAWAFGLTAKVLKWLWRLIHPLGMPLRVASGLLDSAMLAVLILTAWIMVKLEVLRFARQENPPAA